MVRKYATLSWTVHDVLAIRPDWTEEMATDFLCFVEDDLRDRLIEWGWDVLEVFAIVYASENKNGQ